MYGGCHQKSHFHHCGRGSTIAGKEVGMTSGNPLISFGWAKVFIRFLPIECEQE
jgi:hypothetical protein